jgi:hypothetical protein
MWQHLSEYWGYINRLTWVEVSNGAIALLGAGASLRAIFSMDAQTKRAVRCGFVTLATGLFGQGASVFAPSTWQLGYDTLLFGGSLALFIGNRRHIHLGVPEVISPYLAMLAILYSWGVFFLTIK